MESEGAVVVKHIKDLAFMGFWEVLLNIKSIINNLSEDIGISKEETKCLVDVALSSTDTRNINYEQLKDEITTYFVINIFFLTYYSFQLLIFTDEFALKNGKKLENNYEKRHKSLKSLIEEKYQDSKNEIAKLENES